MVFKVICLLVLVLLVTCANAQSGSPLSNVYYTIVHIDGNNLGVEPESYRRTSKRPISFTRVFITSPTNGDYEKWSLVPHLKEKGVYYIVNKATGLYMTVGHEKFGKVVAIFQAAEHTKKEDQNQQFQIYAMNGTVYYQIAAKVGGQRLVLTSISLAGLLAAPETEVNIHLTQWRFQAHFCDPHPKQVYNLVHNQSRRYLSFTPPFIQPKQVSTIDTTFRFVPTKFDRKIYYIQHLESGLVLGGQSKEYGSLLGYGVMDKKQENLSQHWYILTSPDGRKCIFGNVESYRYFGTRDIAVVVLKEHTVTLDEYWYLKTAGNKL